MRGGEGKGFVEWTSGMRQVSFCLELCLQGPSLWALRPGLPATVLPVPFSGSLDRSFFPLLAVKLHQLYPDSQMIDTFFRICVKTGKNDEADDCWTVNHYSYVSQPWVGAFTFLDYQKTAQEED